VWSLAATDRRVVAINPMVFSLIHMEEVSGSNGVLTVVVTHLLSHTIQIHSEHSTVLRCSLLQLYRVKHPQNTTIFVVVATQSENKQNTQASRPKYE
jgi:hypothetical protein